MRKRYWLGGLAVTLLLAAIITLFCLDGQSVTMEVSQGVPVLTVNTPQSSNQVKLWRDEEEGTVYFFLPSCVRKTRVKLKGCKDGMEIDGAFYEEGESFVWEAEREYFFQITDESATCHEYCVVFMKSANIPAFFINTESGSMTYVNSERHHAESGDICVVSADGTTEYQNTLPRIASRGNVSWDKPKKPYTIKLRDKYPLCGLRKGDKWRLLALWNEGSKLNSKLALDMASQLGMENTVQGTWIDLYLNGAYAGIYLLTETVTVGEGRVDIYNLEKENGQYNADMENASRYEEEKRKGYRLDHVRTIDGGYLIEKDSREYYEGEAAGFETSTGYLFSIKEPAHASKEQVDYIADYVENIDRMVQEKDPAVWEVLDLDSLVKAFLVDEISLETDVAVTSMYFYKDAGDGTLYTGPVWDYEHTFGERNVEMLEEYRKLLPYFETVLDTGIDAYTKRIEDSVKMDRVMWMDQNIYGESCGAYADYYANVKYTAFFLAKRLNYLCERWGVLHEPFPAPSDGRMHRVTYAVFEGEVGSMEVMDGEELREPLAYDQSKYQGWTYQFSGEPYSPYIPVYEDMVLYNAKWE